MNIEELKKMSEIEKIKFFMNVKVKELREILKREDVKKTYKMNKSELTNIVFNFIYGKADTSIESTHTKENKDIISSNENIENEVEKRVSEYEVFGEKLIEANSTCGINKRTDVSKLDNLRELIKANNIYYKNIYEYVDSNKNNLSKYCLKDILNRLNRVRGINELIEFNVTELSIRPVHETGEILPF